MTTTKKTTTSKPRATKTTKAPKERVKLPPNPFMHEILDLVDQQRSKAKKIEILKEYECDCLKVLLIWNFDESVISMVPEGEVPYEKNDVPVGTDHTSLRREYKQLYHFVKGGNDSLSGLRRESMYIQMLEGLHPDEADILTLIKDGRLSTKYKVTRDTVMQAYPDITWGGRS
tara:strand:+ start:53 stop:571 length:519 start_codon:yes stop_codon:yes gene_type:complete